MKDKSLFLADTNPVTELKTPNIQNCIEINGPSDTVEIKNQVPKTNTAIRNLRVIPESIIKYKQAIKDNENYLWHRCIQLLGNKG